MIDQKILLFSKSPRRKQLLAEAGFSFEVITAEVDESYPDTLEVREVAEYIARKKADAAKDKLTGNEIILTADTIVLLNNKIYEKPIDHADAVRILSELSGKIHEVITGVCLLTKDKFISFSGVSKVHFAELTREEIEFYLNTYQPFDKAGSYGIQEWIGHCKIHKIEGTYANIMGLPVDLVYETINREFTKKLA